MGVRGAALLGPRRRRGGSREEVLGGVAKGGGTSARGSGSRVQWGDAWGGGEAGGGLQPSQSGGRAALTAGAVEQSRQAGWRWKNLDWFAIFRKFQGPNSKTAITFKLKLK